jgi:hypothetical protein
MASRTKAQASLTPGKSEKKQVDERGER